MKNQDLFSPYDDLPVPDYLDQKFLLEHETRFPCVQPYYRFLISDEKYASLSKHELLFGYSPNAKKWHQTMLQSIQLTIPMCIAWGFLSLCYETLTVVNLLNDPDQTMFIPAKLIMPIFQINALIYCCWLIKDLLPDTLVQFCVLTNTEMMKDREAMETVIQTMKKEKNERHYRVFQALRLMRREYLKLFLNEKMNNDNDETFDESQENSDRKVARETSLESVSLQSSSKRLKEVTVAHIRETF